MSSLEVLDLSLFDVPDPSGDFIDHIVIVGHQQQRAGIPLQRDVQSIDGFQIQMVRGFVQNQEVRFLQHQPAENEPRRFAAGKSFGALERVVAAEQHLAEQSAQFLLGGAADRSSCSHSMTLTPWPDGVPVILREVSDG